MTEINDWVEVPEPKKINDWVDNSIPINKSGTISNSAPGLPGASISMPKGIIAEIGDFFGRNIIRPAVISSGAFLNQGSLGIIPDANKGTPMLNEYSGGQPTLQSIIDKTAYGVGGAAGNLVAGEGISKGIGLVGKLPIVKALRNIRYSSPLSIQASREVKQLPRTLQSQFGKILETAQSKSPDTVVSLTNQLDNLVARSEVDPSIKTVVSKLLKNGGVGKYISDTSNASGLTLREAQDLTNKIMSELPEGYTSNQIKFAFDDAIGSHFPEMKEARALYGAGMSDYNLLHGLEKTGTNINSIRLSLGNNIVQDAAYRRLSAQLNKEMANYADLYKFLNTKKINALGIQTESLAKLIEADTRKTAMLDKIKSMSPKKLVQIFSNRPKPTNLMVPSINLSSDMMSNDNVPSGGE